MNEEGPRIKAKIIDALRGEQTKTTRIVNSLRAKEAVKEEKNTRLSSRVLTPAEIEDGALYVREDDVVIYRPDPPDQTPGQEWGNKKTE